MDYNTCDLNAAKLSYYHPAEPSENTNPKTLLFIHGMGSSKETWKNVIEPLKDQYDIYAIDLRGYGETPLGQVGFTVDYTLDQLSADIHKFVTENHLNNVVVVGHSAGAIVSIAYASQHPDEVKGLIIEDMDLEMPASEPKLTDSQIKQLTGDLSTSETYTSVDLAKTKIDALQIAEGDKTTFKTGEIKKTLDGKKYVITARPYTDRLVSNEWKKASAASKSKSKENFKTLKEKNIPVMLLKARPKIVTDKDKSHVSDEGLKNMKILNPKMEVIEIEDSTHNIHKSKPDAFVKNVREFIDKG